MEQLKLCSGLDNKELITIASRPPGDNAGLVLAKLLAPTAYASRERKGFAFKNDGNSQGK